MEIIKEIDMNKGLNENKLKVIKHLRDFMIEIIGKLYSVNMLYESIRIKHCWDGDVLKDHITIKFERGLLREHMNYIIEVLNGMRREWHFTKDGEFLIEPFIEW